MRSTYRNFMHGLRPCPTCSAMDWARWDFKLDAARNTPDASDDAPVPMLARCPDGHIVPVMAALSDAGVHLIWPELH